MTFLRIHARLRYARLLMNRAFCYIGAHTGKDRDNNELERARQRIGMAIFILLVLAASRPWRGGAFGVLWIAPAMCIVDALVALFHVMMIKRRPGSMVPLQYFFIVFDPISIAVFLADSPKTTALMSPYLLFIVMRIGMRYGVRSLWLAWASAIFSVPAVLLLGSPFWRQEVQLTLSVITMLILIPPFFVPLLLKVRGQHKLELDESQLVAMERAMIQKSAFLAKVSHELRSPLQAIVGSLHLMESRSGGEKMRPELMGTISSSAKKLSMQLRDLLTIAKSEAWELEHSPAIFDAGALLESVATSIEPDAEKRGLEVVTVLPPEATFLIADGDRIIQILENLAKNAVQYTTAGSVTLAMRAYDAEARSITFVVEDTGPGIKTDRMPLMFEHQSRGLSVRERTESLSAGLGLSVVRTLVELLGGTVKVENVEGTRFTVTIPCELATDDPGEDADGPMMSMVISESAAARLALAPSLEKLGVPVDWVASVAVAANKLAYRRYGLVLVDLGIARRRGWQLAAETRRSKGVNEKTLAIAFGGSKISDVKVTPWPFDAEIVGDLSEGKLRRAIASQAQQ